MKSPIYNKLHDAFQHISRVGMAATIAVGAAVSPLAAEESPAQGRLEVIAKVSYDRDDCFVAVLHDQAYSTSFDNLVDMWMDGRPWKTGTRGYHGTRQYVTYSNKHGVPFPDEFIDGFQSVKLNLLLHLILFLRLNFDRLRSHNFEFHLPQQV